MTRAIRDTHSWRAFQTAMLHDLALALKCELDALPHVFLSPKPRPLRVGIFEELAAKYTPDEAWLRDWLAAWVSHPKYLERIARGRHHRCGLDGNEVEPITDEQRKHAQLLLSEITQRTVRQRCFGGTTRMHVEGLMDGDVEAVLDQTLNALLPIYKKRRTPPLFDPTLLNVVKRCGQILYVMGGLSLMRDVARNVTEKLPWGIERRVRLRALDAAWDGMGCGGDGFWDRWRA